MRKYIYLTAGYTLIIMALLFFYYFQINGTYKNHSGGYTVRHIFLKAVFLAAPATVPAGRNIAFENGNAVANAPASYLTMLDCCESDEAIADRIAVGLTQCRIIRKDTQQRTPSD